jgi:branched-chain amino acid transport system ATP-binding protein
LLLDIKKLIVHYGSAEVLQGVSIGVVAGNIISIVGANGAGKTTILRAISGLKKPTSGEISFQDTSLIGLTAPKVARLGIAHIPAGKMLFAPLSVLDNLKIGAYLRKDKEEIRKDFELVYGHFPVLKQKINAQAGSLSGGQQQMLAIGRALMSRPKLLMMDEPSTGLSPILVSEVSRIIKDINAAGMSILLVEQNARLAFKLSQKAYILEVGKIILEGKSQDLVNNELVKQAYMGSKV